MSTEWVTPRSMPRADPAWDRSPNRETAGGTDSPETGADETGADDPPVNAERMSGPGEEIDEAG